MNGTALAAATCIFSGFLHHGDAAAQGARYDRPTLARYGPATASDILTPQSTKITSEKGKLPLSTSAVYAFDPLTVTCTGFCVFRMTISAQLLRLNTDAKAVVTVNNSGADILPANPIVMMDGLGNGLLASSFTVWRQDLPSGDYVVRVKFRLGTRPGGGERGQARLRTLSVDVFSCPDLC